jgi:hypothetical protein
VFSLFVHSLGKSRSGPAPHVAALRRE